MDPSESQVVRLVLAAGVLTLAAAESSAQELIFKRYGDSTATFGVYGLGFAGDAGGDLTGDGVPDVLAGTPYDSSFGLDSGIVRLFSGADGSTVYSLHGASAGELIGGCIAIIGDLNGDGCADFETYAPLPTSALPYQGDAIIYSGKSGTVLYDLKGSSTYEALGLTAAALGDLDLDGIPDFVLGAPGPGGQHALVVSGVDGSVIWTLKPTSSQSTDFADSVGGGGDVDADGVPDIVVGDYLASIGAVQGGAVLVFSGRTGASLYEFDSTVSYSGFGYSATIAGDVDADGYADVLIGAPGDDTWAQSGGSATVYSGKDGSILLYFAPPVGPNGQDDQLGASVRGFGDANGDGHADLLVSSPGGEGFSGTGTVYLYSGRDGSSMYHFQDSTDLTSYGTFGRIAVRGGDLDGDGHGDIVITDSGDDDGSKQNVGSVSVWRGRDLFVDAMPRRASAYMQETLTVGQGIASAPYALFLVNLNGTSMFNLLSIGLLDGTGRAQLSGSVPQGLGLVTLQFQGFALDANGKLLRTGVETLYLY